MSTDLVLSKKEIAKFDEETRAKIEEINGLFAKAHVMVSAIKSKPKRIAMRLALAGFIRSTDFLLRVTLLGKRK